MKTPLFVAVREMRARRHGKRQREGKRRRKREIGKERRGEDEEERAVAVDSDRRAGDGARDWVVGWYVGALALDYAFDGR